MKKISKEVKVCFKDYINGKIIYTEAKPIIIMMKQRRQKSNYEAKKALQKMFSKAV